MIPTTQYVELHCHSNYSFYQGASFIQEILARAVELGYHALAITDQDNLCGAMEFAQAARSLGIQPIIGAEVTLAGGHHMTLLAETRQGYSNLCKLISFTRMDTDRKRPELDHNFIVDHTQGLIFLSGCPNGEIPSLAQQGRMSEARDMAEKYIRWFGSENVYLELEQNLVYGDTTRNRRLAQIARSLGIGIVATNNVHYHVMERHQLQDCLVSIRHRKSLEESHRERRANSQFYMKSSKQMIGLFLDYPEAITNTLIIADRCASFDLTRNLDYKLPESLVPDGLTQESYLRHLCEQSAIRRYGFVDNRVKARLDEEFRLIRRHNLTGFLLIYHDIIQLAREVAIDLGLTDKGIPIEENPPGRGRGSSVAMLVGYLIGLSHIDPLEFGLSLERFLPDDDMASVPDIDLDFPRNIRSQVIKRVHEKYGWEHAALTGMISTYKLRGAVKDLGLALGLPMDQVDRLAKRAEPRHASSLSTEMEAMPEFRGMTNAPIWSDLVRLSKELDGFPKYLAQHPGGMVIGSESLIDLVPVQPSAIEGRYIMHWDKNSIEDAGFVKIDFLSLGALSQMQEACYLIESRTGHRPDLSRVDFNDQNVYDMICQADTIGIFQVESAAQMQTTPRIRPRNLFDMAHQVAAVRPGVGVNDGVSQYIRRRNKVEPVIFEHPSEHRALARTHGVILFQDQVNQVAIDVAGFSPLEADQLRRAYGRRNNLDLLQAYSEKFKEGAAKRGIDEETAKRIFAKFSGHYMFPESHAFAFGVTAYQAAWLKLYYPLEFFVAIFNQQPMGFYNLETLKEDARRHGIQVLKIDMNLSWEKCIPEDGALRLGFLNVRKVGPTTARAIIESRNNNGLFTSVADFMKRSGLHKQALDNLADAGAFDSITHDRRALRWEIGLLYNPIKSQIPLSLPTEQDMIGLDPPSDWETMQREYMAVDLHTNGHIMANLRKRLGKSILTSKDIVGLDHGTKVTVAGLIIRRQQPLGKSVYVTLEDEYGHISMILWPRIYQKLREVFKEPLVIADGYISRREGTMNVVVTYASVMPPIQVALNPRSTF